MEKYHLSYLVSLFLFLNLMGFTSVLYFDLLTLVSKWKCGTKWKTIETKLMKKKTHLFSSLATSHYLPACRHQREALTEQQAKTTRSPAVYTCDVSQAELMFHLFERSAERGSVSLPTPDSEPKQHDRSAAAVTCFMKWFQTTVMERDKYSTVAHYL